MGYTILQGDVLERLRAMDSESVQCVVASPPYWGLRDYKVPASTWPDGWRGCYGLEPTHQMYIAHTVSIFAEVNRVLRKNGVLWLNLGDAYAGSWGAQSRGSKEGSKTNLMGASHEYGLSARQINAHPDGSGIGSVKRTPGLKPKDLIGIPWRVALALQDWGWWLRCDVVWSKPNPMPESVTDRPTRAHEYMFLMTKRAKYFYDAAAIKEPAQWLAENGPGTGVGWNKGDIADIGEGRVRVKALDKQSGHGRRHAGFNKRWDDREKGSASAPMGREAGWRERERTQRDNFKRDGNKRSEPVMPNTNASHRPNRASSDYSLLTRNKRTVWEIPTSSYPEAHFATFPAKLVEPCVLAGSRPGDVVLDPFCGSGTTMEVAVQHGRQGLGIEINPEYVAMAHRRLDKKLPLLCVDGEG